MLLRIVRMEFKKEKVKSFLDYFHQVKEHIRNFPGCHDVQLYQDAEKENVFYTYSLWESQEALENYRNSTLFKNTWRQVKPWFSAKAMAFSLVKKAE